MEKECSRVGFIWFQENYPFPIASDIVNQISLLEWAEISQDAYF